MKVTFLRYQKTLIRCVLPIFICVLLMTNMGCHADNVAKDNSSSVSAQNSLLQTTDSTINNQFSTTTTSPPTITTKFTTVTKTTTTTTTKEKTTTTKKPTNTLKPSLIEKEPLPDGIVCGYEWLNNIARAATEEELRAYQKEKGISDDLIWCEHCGRPTMAMSVDGQLFVCGGIYGTCMRRFSGGDWMCACCGAVVPVNTCHTCGVPVKIEPLPGTIVHSPEQLTTAHREFLMACAKSVSESLYGGEDNETFVSLYAFVLTDNTAISSQSKCVCFFVFTSEKPYSSTPVYHTGELYNISILDNGSLIYQTKAEEFKYYNDETSAVASYKAIGQNITKIS